VFAVKGRPTNHPLIVHVASAEELSNWARDVPSTAYALADAFWPGPLTLILSAQPHITSGVTGGLPTIALRIPRHPLTLALLRELGSGVAAPSANRFGRVSPTSADHVRQDLGSDVDFVLDGGACQVGLESTVVDLSTGSPAILRPGGVLPEQIEQVLGVSVGLGAQGPVKSPGQLPSHYAPRARVVIVDASSASQAVADLRAQGTAAELLFDAATDEHTIARHLYDRLRELDAAGCEVIIAIEPRGAGLGLAVADRLRRAAAPRPD
jgi:L-threonylcarbamoyladenylate synthase